MNEVITYILRVTLAITIAYAGYALFLRNRSSLTIRRVYLLAAILLSWLAPAIRLGIPALGAQLGFAGLDALPGISVPAGDPGAAIIPGPLEITGKSGSLTTASGTAAGASPFFLSLPLLAWAYLAGVLLISVRLLLSLSGFSRTVAAKDPGRKNVWITRDKRIFSLFRRIYIPSAILQSPDLDPILIHERAHVRQWHVIDLILSEINLVLTWFNPFSWLISRMIRENHEYLADRAVLSEGFSPGRYKALLLEYAVGAPLSRLSNPLNHSLTKKRFIMMKKNKPTGRGIAFSSLVTTALLSVILLVTANCQGNRTIEGNVLLEPGAVPGTGTSVILKGTTLGTVVDREGMFHLELPDGIEHPELVFSFVGYGTEVRDAYAINGTTIRLTPRSYTLDLEGVEGKPEDMEVKPEDMEEKPSPAETKEPQPIKGQKEIFYVVEELPSFPGGKAALVRYLEANLVYPEKAREEGMEGKVMVEFKVGTDGALSQIEITDSPSDALSAEALRLVRGMPDWEPGKQRGKPVSTIISLPVRFESDRD